MLQNQLCYGILIALIAVGLFSRGMFRQQNNEGPSSSHSSGPASLQHNVIQAAGAGDSKFEQTPEVRVVQSNIQQDEAYLQNNVIGAANAKKCNFIQKPKAERVTQDAANWKDPLRMGLFLVGLFLAGMLYQHYNVLAGFFQGDTLAMGNTYIQSKQHAKEK